METVPCFRMANWRSSLRWLLCWEFVVRGRRWREWSLRFEVWKQGGSLMFGRVWGGGGWRGIWIFLGEELNVVDRLSGLDAMWIVEGGIWDEMRWDDMVWDGMGWFKALNVWEGLWGFMWTEGGVVSVRLLLAWSGVVLLWNGCRVYFGGPSANPLCGANVCEVDVCVRVLGFLTIWSRARSFFLFFIFNLLVLVRICSISFPTTLA